PPGRRWGATPNNIALPDRFSTPAGRPEGPRASPPGPARGNSDARAEHVAPAGAERPPGLRQAGPATTRPEAAPGVRLLPPAGVVVPPPRPGQAGPAALPRHPGRHRRADRLLGHAGRLLREVDAPPRRGRARRQPRRRVLLPHAPAGGDLQ